MEKRLRWRPNGYGAKKFVAGLAATAAATAASYAIYRELGKRYSDVVLDSGKELHYINALGEKADYDRRLYTSFEKGDTRKYKGLLATALRSKKENTTIYDSVLRATKTIKAPSQHDAAKLYSEFLNSSPVSGPKISYRDMNKNIVYGDPTAKKFMAFLETKGYNAILDANDQFISGYNTKKPLILFNAASSVVKVGESVVEKKTSDRLNALHMASLYAKAYAPTIGLGAAYVGGAAALDTKTKYNAVNQYFAKHPDTTLSYGAVYNALKPLPNGTFVVNKSLLEGA